MQLTSDEIFIYECGPCKSDDKISEAKHYCRVCDDYLCEDCRTHHRKFKELRNHKIQSVNKISRASEEEQSGIPGVKCMCNQNLVEFFCEGHVEVICGPCKTIKHRKCKIYTIQDKVASLKTSKQGHVLSKVRSLVGKIEHMQIERNTEKNKTARLRDECKDKIEIFQRKLNSLLDGMKNDLRKDLEPLCDQHIQDIDDQVSSLKTTLPIVKSDCKLLEEIEQNGTKEAIFAAGIKVSKKLGDYEMALLDIETETKTFSLTFEPNTNLESMMKKSKLGSLKTSPNKDSPPHKNDTSVILGKKIVSSSKVNVRLANEETVPPYINVCFMPNGKLLVLDTENKTIKLLNQSFIHEGHLELPDPYAVTAIDDNTAIVYVFDDKSGENKLQYIHTTPHLKKGHSISIDVSCICVKHLDDELYVIDVGEDGFVVGVLDPSGNKKRQISVDKDENKFREEGFLSICPESKKIYASDTSFQTIYCLESDGRPVYQYKDETWGWGSLAIYVDKADNVLVCGENSVNILTAQGKKHATLLSSKDGLKGPFSLDYRPSDGALVVGCYGDEYLHIFKLA